MKYIAFVFSTLIAATLIIILDRPLGPAPALGRFFSPFDGFWQNAENAKKYNDKTVEFDELKSSVEIVFDKRLVPHIFAKNEHDLFFMQGYITAQNRLWQMEIQTHNAAGRVSEIIGEKGLDNDRLQRRIGLEYGAKNAQDYIAQDPESKAIIDAYCNGINAYISSLSIKEYPIEYKLLGYAPEPWTPLKVALLLKNMANMLSVYEFDIENTNFLASYGQAQLDYLYKSMDDFTDFIIPKGTTYDFEPVAGFDAPKKHKNDAVTSKDIAPYESYNQALAKPDEIKGSNNWAVAGQKTSSGKPILCNDPHLQLNLPSIWYEVHLVSPTMNVYGASLPGSPGVISGFNDSIAWGVTNAGRDVRDWFQIQFKDDTHNEYLVDGQWLKTEKKIERFNIKGERPFIDTVLYTKYGPIVFDQSYKQAKSKNLLALKWTAHMPSNEMKTFIGLNKGKNYDDYRKALTFYNCPAQNFVFASRSNDIAMVEQGLFPNVAEEVVDGTDSKNDWTVFVPNEHNPMMKNPARGFVSSANQMPVENLYPYPISKIGVYESFRAIRINQLLTQGNNIDVAFMKKMQGDNFNIFAKMILPTLIFIAENSGKVDEDRGYFEQLKNWDFMNNADQIAPVWFEAWSTQFVDLLWDEMAQPDLPMKRPNNYLTANFLKQDSTSVFYDNLQTGERENRTAIVLQSWAKAKVSLIEKYGSFDKIPNWSTHKATTIKHIAKLDPFSKLNVYCGGNRGIINATNADHGPSWKMIVDFGDMQGYCVYPGGESGNPGSPFYDNMIDTWAKGEYYTANFNSNIEVIKKQALYTLSIQKK